MVVFVSQGLCDHHSALDWLSSGRFETPAILKSLALASRKLAELKGVAASIPNQSME
jgi:hypothetical protein